MSDNGGGSSGERGRRRRRRHPKKDRDTPGAKGTPKDSDSRETTPVPATPLTPTRTPVILAKPDRERRDSAEESSSIPGAAAAASKQPDRPFTVKMRDDPSASAAGSKTPTDSGTPTYRIQKSFVPSSIIPLADGTPQSRMAPPPEISHSIKLVDESLQWSDMGMEMLVDQAEYLVVGVIGNQGVGKSTILAALAGNKIDAPYKSFVFRPQSQDVLESCAHQTAGIDMYVTSERVIILDTQPILSSSVLFNIINQEKKIPPEYTSAENYHEMQSLQIVSFMYTVCNVVLVVVDWFADLFLMKFLQTAEMLKPPTPSASHDSGSTGDDHVEYYPHLAFIVNKAESSDFRYDVYTAMERTIRKVFAESKLRYRGGNISTRDSNLLSNLPLNDDRVNLFLLPKFDPISNSSSSSKSNTESMYSLLPEFKGHPSFEFLIGQLRNQIYSVPRNMLTHTTLSEKNWFHYAARTWESIRKFQLFAEYNRLLF